MRAAISGTQGTVCNAQGPALLLLVINATTSAATMYISDELTVPLRRGPTNGHRIIHAGLPSGTAA